MKRDYFRMDYDIEEMFSLRRAGWSYSALGRKYGKDHTTIMYHCNEHGVVPEVPVKPFRNPVRAFVKALEKRRPFVWDKETKKFIDPSQAKIEPPAPKVDKYAEIISPKTKKPRSYASLLKEAMRRPAERHYFQTETLVIH